MNRNACAVGVSALLIASLILLGPRAMAEGEDLQGNSPQGIRYGGGDEILLQGFHWNSIRLPAGDWYTTLLNQAALVGKDGFTGVWLPPPWRDVSK